MHLYEERLERDLDRIRDEVWTVGQRIERALQGSLRAVLTLDRALASEVIIGDKIVNSAIDRIDRHAHQFVARHLPSAGHLRFISSILRMNVELERIGDYAATIGRETAQMSHPLQPTIRREVERMGKNASHMLHQALTAFRDHNVELARAIIHGDLIERSFTAAFEELVRLSEVGKRSIKDEFATLVVFNMLERVGDQAVNIAEEMIFAATGESSQQVVYRILFLDKHNDVLGPMAVSIGRKAFAEAGNYRTAGSKPADELSPGLIDFLEKHGNATDDLKPQAIDWVPEAWSDYDVVVSLQGSIEKYLDEIPFRTVVLEWDIAAPPKKSANESELDESFETIYKELAPKITHLMETLQGEEPS